MKFFLKVLYIVIFTSGVILGAMIWLAPNVIEKIFGSPTVLTAKTRWIMYPDKAYKLTFDMKTNGFLGLIGTKRVIIKNMVKETKVEETSYWLILSSEEGEEYLYDGVSVIPVEYGLESFDTNTFEEEEEWKPLEGFENNTIN